jgi:hypothetical protein
VWKQNALTFIKNDVLSTKYNNKVVDRYMYENGVFLAFHSEFQREQGNLCDVFPSVVIPTPKIDGSDAADERLALHAGEKLMHVNLACLNGQRENYCHWCRRDKTTVHKSRKYKSAKCTFMTYTSLMPVATGDAPRIYLTGVFFRCNECGSTSMNSCSSAALSAAPPQLLHNAGLPVHLESTLASRKTYMSSAFYDRMRASIGGETVSEMARVEVRAAVCDASTLVCLY